MAKSSDNRMIVGLDIGTSKVVAVVGVTPGRSKSSVSVRIRRAA
jgi:cell division ATPase FtsA